MNPFLFGPPAFPRAVSDTIPTISRELFYLNYMNYLFQQRIRRLFSFPDPLNSFQSTPFDFPFTDLANFYPFSMPYFTRPPNPSRTLHEMLRNINSMMNSLNISQQEGITALRNAIYHFDQNLSISRERLRQLGESFDREFTGITERLQKPEKLTKEQINAIPCLVYQGTQKTSSKGQKEKKNGRDKLLRASKKIKKQTKVSTSSEPTCYRTCCICITDYKKGDTMRELGCKHRFHRRCIDAWLGRKNICPICNKKQIPEIPSTNIL